MKSGEKEYKVDIFGKKKFCLLQIWIGYQAKKKKVHDSSTIRIFILSTPKGQVLIYEQNGNQNLTLSNLLSKVIKKIKDWSLLSCCSALDLGRERKKEFGKDCNEPPKFLEFDSDQKEMISEIQDRLKNNDSSSCETLLSHLCFNVPK